MLAWSARPWWENSKGIQVPNDGVSYQRIASDEGRNKFLVVDFYAPSCPHCIEAQPAWNKVVDEISATLGDEVMFLKVDGTNNRFTAQRYGIHRFPSFVIVQPGTDGQVYNEWVPNGPDPLDVSLAKWITGFVHFVNGTASLQKV